MIASSCFGIVSPSTSLTSFFCEKCIDVCLVDVIKIENRKAVASTTSISAGGRRKNAKKVRFILAKCYTVDCIVQVLGS